METTLILIKPDGVQRRLAGTIINRFEKKGLQIVGAKLLWIDQALAAKHYAEHKEKPFFQDLVNFITSSPVLALALRGARAVELCRKIMGATFGFEAEAGTIRGDYGASRSFNLVHGSDSAEKAQRELALFFKPEELLDYPSGDRSWIFSPEDLAE